MAFFTRISRGNLLHGVGNRLVRSAINGLVPRLVTAYDTSSAGQAFVGTGLVASNILVLDNVIANTFYNVTGTLNLAISAAAGNIKFDFGASTAVGSNFGGSTIFTATGTATTLAVDFAALNTSMSGGTTTAWTRAFINFSFFCTQSGTIALEAAQVAASGTLSISNGSFLEANPLDFNTQY